MDTPKKEKDKLTKKKKKLNQELLKSRWSACNTPCRGWLQTVRRRKSLLLPSPDTGWWLLSQSWSKNLDGWWMYGAASVQMEQSYKIHNEHNAHQLINHCLFSAVPSPELVERIRDLYHKRVPDVRFLIPVLNGLLKVRRSMFMLKKKC